MPDLQQKLLFIKKGYKPPSLLIPTRIYLTKKNYSSVNDWITEWLQMLITKEMIFICRPSDTSQPQHTSKLIFGYCQSICFTVHHETEHNFSYLNVSHLMHSTLNWVVVEIDYTWDVYLQRRWIYSYVWWMLRLSKMYLKRRTINCNAIQKIIALEVLLFWNWKIYLVNHQYAGDKGKMAVLLNSLLHSVNSFINNEYHWCLVGYVVLCSAIRWCAGDGSATPIVILSCIKDALPSHFSPHHHASISPSYTQNAAATNALPTWKPVIWFRGVTRISR